MKGWKCCAALGWLVEAGVESPAEQVLVAPVSLVVAADVEDLPRLPLFIASLGKQTVMPAEVTMVIHIPLDSGYQGALLLPHETKIDFDLYEPDMHRPALEEAMRQAGTMGPIPTVAPVRNERPSVAEREGYNRWAALLDMAATDVFLKAPAVRIWVRSGPQLPVENLFFGVSKSRYPLVSFFSASDLMDVHRIERINEAFVARPEIDALVHQASVLHIDACDDECVQRTTHTHFRGDAEPGDQSLRDKLDRKLKVPPPKLELFTMEYYPIFEEVKACFAANASKAATPPELSDECIRIFQTQDLSTLLHKPLHFDSLTIRVELLHHHPWPATHSAQYWLRQVETEQPIIGVLEETLALLVHAQGHKWRGEKALNVNNPVFGEQGRQTPLPESRI